MTKTVIIAVNDPNILYLLQRYAEESGFLAVNAHRSKGGREIDVLALLAQQTNPALIILDAEWSCATDQKVGRLRAEAATRHIPIVIYSCLDDPAEERHEGVAGCLPKSVMYDDFVATLKRAGVGLEPAFP